MFEPIIGSHRNELILYIEDNQKKYIFQQLVYTRINGKIGNKLFYFFQFIIIIISMRINRFLAKCGLGSRRKCEKLILANEISINDDICTDLSYIIKKNDVVKYKDKIVKPQKLLLYYKFNKPIGVITSMNDDLGRKDISFYLKKNNIKDRVFPIGRLDSDSKGLLILTNDGKLAHKIAHPKYEIDKKYKVTVEGILSEDKKKQLENGIRLEEGITSPCKIGNISILKNKNLSIFTMIIHQGWKRQIRRMISSVNLEVTSLIRVSIGNIKLAELKEGEIKSIPLKDIETLKRKFI